MEQPFQRVRLRGLRVKPPSFIILICLFVAFIIYQTEPTRFAMKVGGLIEVLYEK